MTRPTSLRRHGAGPLRVLSLGAGVQSTTVALMSATGDLPRLDGCVFADTAWEPREVYEHLAWLEAVLRRARIPVHRVSAGNIRSDALDPHHRFASMPLFVKSADGSKGMIRRQCTSEYKIKPIERRLRALAGLQPRQRSSEILVEQWVGISWDEVERMSDASFPWIFKRYPLVDLRMTRLDCHRWLASHGVTAPRSACLGCPFHTDREWRRIRDGDPEGWADAVAFDRAIRSGNIAQAGRQQLLGEANLHRSLVPLDQVDLATEEDRGQGTLEFVDVTGHEWSSEPRECGMTCSSEDLPLGFQLVDIATAGGRVVAPGP